MTRDLQTAYRAWISVTLQCILGNVPYWQPTDLIYWSSSYMLILAVFYVISNYRQIEVIPANDIRIQSSEGNIKGNTYTQPVTKHIPQSKMPDN